MKKVFLISSSRYNGGGFWNHCLISLKNFLGKPVGKQNKILFIPYANADMDYVGYTDLIAKIFSEFGYEVVGMHNYASSISFLRDESICAVCVGGGNTWLLSNAREVTCVLPDIRDKVDNGEWKYISASAGTVMACNSVITTNDMCPINSIKNTQGFGIVPFQINPHFVPGALVDKHMGETREERIRQVILHNHEWQVVGLPESCWIEGYGKKYILRGSSEAVIFRKDGNNSIWLPGEPFDGTGML
ncbi:MAG: dipeptidase PepE [Patescibacteria group bacterium]|nr:dipeptidase PepE [Patescibacteria group bacterium]